MTGCKNNRYELDQIIRWAIKSTVPVVDESEADFCVINTCTVTHVADKKSRQMVRRTKNSNPKLKTIVFGCAARMQKEAFEQISEIDYLLDDLPAVLYFLDEAIKQSAQSKNLAVDQVKYFPRMRTRALTQIQDGCDNFCTYCIIAEARGRSESRPEEDIIAEIKEHEKNGYNEVVLTGINIGAYGAPLSTKYEENTLADLLTTILERTDIPRIRLSSLGPQYFDDRLYDILKNPRICRHIHLSIQSGSTSVLEKMSRQYTADQVAKVIERLRADQPDVAITTDIIVGFPGETDEEFEETVDFVRNNQLAKVHVFPYSVRKNTSASKMEQVPDDIRKARAQKLQKVADEGRQAFLTAQIGKTVLVLWEKTAVKGVYEGLSDNYIRVRKESDQLIRVGTIGSEKMTKQSIVL